MSADRFLFLLRAFAPEASGAAVHASPDARWSWWSNGLLVVPRHSANGRFSDEAAFTTLHEACHALLSRRHIFRIPRPVDLPANLCHFLWNLLEDHRIERWLADLMPQASEWYRALYRRETRADPPRKRGESCIFDLIWEFWRPGETPGYPPLRLPRALREAALDYITCIPPARHSSERAQLARRPPDHALRLLYIREVHPLLISPCAATMPDAWEAEVRLSAARAWRILYERILPLFRELAGEEIDDLNESVSSLAEMLERLLRRRRSRAMSPARPTAAPTIPYAQLRRAVQPAAQRLRARLEPILVRRSRDRRALRWGGGRIDLRSAMEADRAWARGITRPFPVFRGARNPTPGATIGVLIDLSGSMHGEKIRAAVKGVAMLAEALSPLDQVKLVIAGFQDRLIPVMDGALDRQACTAIERMPLALGRQEAHYNDDGPCLLEFAQIIAAKSPPHLILVISDGLPEGRHSTADDLHRAVRRVQSMGMALIGLGLGKGTRHVARFYPASLPEISVEELPERLAQLVEGFLDR